MPTNQTIITYLQFTAYNNIAAGILKITIDGKGILYPSNTTIITKAFMSSAELFIFLNLPFITITPIINKFQTYTYSRLA
jgi:hypothetical protein